MNSIEQKNEERKIDSTCGGSWRRNNEPKSARPQSQMRVKEVLIVPLRSVSLKGSHGEKCQLSVHAPPEMKRRRRQRGCRASHGARERDISFPHGRKNKWRREGRGWGAAAGPIKKQLIHRRVFSDGRSNECPCPHVGCELPKTTRRL